MTTVRLHLVDWAAWAPGLETDDAVAAWAHGKHVIRNTDESPPLTFLPPLFRRRLSQLSRMALEVGHRLVKERQPPLPCVFSSRYGEVNKQYAITEGLLEGGEVSPAVFSLSVFNTPISLLSIAEHNTGAASALCADGYGLAGAFFDALGFLRPESAIEECLILFADEAVPPIYLPLLPTPPEPFAFALILSSCPRPSSRPLTLTLADSSGPAAPVHPLELLRWLELGAAGRFPFQAPGLDCTLETGASC